MPIGAPSKPCSAIHGKPVISPLPLNEKAPAKTKSPQVSGPRGQIAVIPVRTTLGVSRNQREIADRNTRNIGDGVERPCRQAANVKSETTQSRARHVHTPCRIDSPR